MASSSCVTSSITLAPGTSFILPPGSTIIGATDPASLTSECADLTNLETPICYVATLGSRTAEGSTSDFFETNQQRVYGYWLNNQYTAFSSYVLNSGAIGTFDVGQIFLRLKETISTITGGNATYSGNTNNGTRSNLLIKTFPSIGETLELEVATNANFGTQTDVHYRIKFVPLTLLIAGGIIDLPTCP